MENIEEFINKYTNFLEDHYIKIVDVFKESTNDATGIEKELLDAIYLKNAINDVKECAENCKSKINDGIKISIDGHYATILIRSGSKGYRIRIDPSSIPKQFSIEQLVLWGCDFFINSSIAMLENGKLDKLISYKKAELDAFKKKEAAKLEKAKKKEERFNSIVNKCRIEVNKDVKDDLIPMRLDDMEYTFNSICPDDDIFNNVMNYNYIEGRLI